MTVVDECWADEDPRYTQDPDEPAEPEVVIDDDQPAELLPAPAQRLAADSRNVGRLAHDLPDIANYQPSA